MENLVTDHFSCLPLSEEQLPLKDDFPDEHLFQVQQSTLWYADIFNYLVTNVLPYELSKVNRDRIKKEGRCIG